MYINLCICQTIHLSIYTLSIYLTLINLNRNRDRRNSSSNNGMDFIDTDSIEDRSIVAPYVGMLI
jgi:hypothetical protein